MNELIIYGAFEQNKLIGILGIKNNRKHISLFFIQPEHHRKGIGKNSSIIWRMIILLMK